jgi:hypothetical protein
MEREETFEKFIEKVFTKEDLSVLADQIEEAARWVYKGGQADFSEKIKAAVSEEFRRIVVTLEEEGEFPSGYEEQKTFFNELKKYLESFPVVKLILAFSPSGDFLKNLSKWVKEQIGKEAVLEILVKEEIVGGAVVEYSGEYRDYSLVRKLDELLGEGEAQSAKIKNS